MGRRDPAIGEVEGGKEGGGAVPLIVIAATAERATARQPQIALRPFERLDRRLLIDADDDGVLGRRHVEADHVCGLGDKLAIVALAPRFASVEIDAFLAQEEHQTCCS